MLFPPLIMNPPVSTSPPLDDRKLTTLCIVFALRRALPFYVNNSQDPLQDRVANLRQILDSMNVQELGSAKVAPSDVIVVFQGHVIRVSRLC